MFADASFANNKEMSSQIGFIVCMVDETYTTNILLYGSIKSKRIARSAHSEEILKIAQAFSQASTIRLSTIAMLGRKIHLKLYTDSHSLYERLGFTKSTTEKYLLIDLSRFRRT